MEKRISQGIFSGPARRSFRRRMVLSGISFLCLLCIFMAFMPCMAAGGEPDPAGYGEETALIIDGEEHSLAEFNYYFNSWYSSFTESNAAYLPYMFDEAKSLKEQEYEEGRSWFDYFTEQAALSMQQILVLAGRAKDEGLVLSQADLDRVEEVYDALTGFAETFRMEPADYLELFYGKGMDPELFRKCLTDTRLADAYAGKIRAAYAPSGEEIAAWYKEHIQDYTTVRYERFFARASSMGTVPSPEQKEKARQNAQVVYDQVEDGASLQEASAAYEEEGVYYDFDDASYIEGSVYGDWLFDPQRQDGDLLMTEEANGWYVMVFHERNESDYRSANVLDAYFPLDSSLEGADEQMENSCLQAEAFLKLWQESGGDEAAFTEMALEQALQSGREAVVNGALKDTFEEKISDWIFDDARKEGDCAVLYAPEGFHVVYWRGRGGPAWESLVKADLQEAAYQDWFEEQMSSSKMERIEEVLAHAGGYE